MSMTGNLMGDFKPDAELRRRLPIEIIRGIENHRLVDRLTDRFQPVKQLRPLFSEQRRRYAGIITDIAFDYFLIKHWDPDKNGEIDQFIEQCYAGLLECRHWMPARMAYVVTRMHEHRWLQSYASMEGVGQTIDQVSKRIRFDNKMAGGVVEVEQNYAAIEAGFLALYQHLQEQLAIADLERGIAG